MGLVELNGSKEKVLIRNTGRMGELLVSGRRVFLKEKASGKLNYELFYVETDSSLVCVNSHIAPELFLEWAKASRYPEEIKSFKREVTVGSSRFDLLINGRWLVEVKSVNLVRERVAMFPDAPTKRGARHVKELVENSGEYKPLLIFVVLRQDAKGFKPNCSTDKEFCKEFHNYVSRGFPVKVLSCKLELGNIIVSAELPLAES